MKYLVPFLLLVSTLSCSSLKSKETNEYYSTPQEYSFIDTNSTIDFEVLEYHPTDFYCFTEGGTPYGVFVGKPLNSKISPRISFLAKCENRNFKIGQVLTATPTKLSPNLPPLKTYISTINGNTKITELIGAQYPALWCTVEEQQK